MRIISGKFRGLKLHSPTNIEIRPTSDRLRESLFSIINSNKYDINIIDANVIDICTGTGALGIEALSRGAKNLYLIDNEQNSLDIVKTNLSKIKSYDIKSSVYIRKADAKKPFKNINLIFNIVLIDPPYNSSIIQQCLPLLKEYNLIDKNSLIFAETSKQETISVGNFKVLDTKFYGKSKLTIMKLLDLSSIK
ncbi:16S rRNA (guanine(966)-N(2))-methyltransferase RsmD [Alphaproteobacteria bacterium]|nr:16S rRNA (guanine(966)-N(2))-methyltransferase RsmD [Alphaproteobacteria bacterium]